MKRTVCYCIPVTKWYNTHTKEVTRETEEYITTCAINASKGDFTNLLNLKQLGMNVNDARAKLAYQIPFKLHSCPFGINCCGMCAKVCKYRCVQDMLNKLYMKAAPMMYDKSNKDENAQAAYYTLTNHMLNYSTLMDTFNSMCTKIGGSETEKEKNKNTDKRNFMYDYAPVPVGKYDKAGNIIRVRNPSTGEVMLHEWPATGLCPYCMPNVMYLKKRSGGRKHRASNQEVSR